ncbi:hypothetical protein [Streptomyces virginiae]|nr:hypothetical protein [Streptomyces virginiae]WSC74970.1 hypothetical protein OHA56_00740 [Streptomyces virginiae]
MTGNRRPTAGGRRPAAVKVPFGIGGTLVPEALGFERGPLSGVDRRAAA